MPGISLELTTDDPTLIADLGAWLEGRPSRFEFYDLRWEPDRIDPVTAGKLASVLAPVRGVDEPARHAIRHLAKAFADYAGDFGLSDQPARRAQRAGAAVKEALHARDLTIRAGEP